MEQLKLPAILMDLGAARSLGQVSHFPLSWAVSLCQLTNSHPDWSWPHRIRSSEFRPWCPVSLPEAAVFTPLFQLHLWVCNWNHRVWTGSQVHAATNRTTCDLTKGARLAVGLLTAHMTEKVKQKPHKLRTIQKENNLDEVPLLPSYHREHPNALHITVVLGMLSGREKASAENNKECTEHDCLLSALAGRH